MPLSASHWVSVPSLVFSISTSISAALSLDHKRCCWACRAWSTAYLKIKTQPLCAVVHPSKTETAFCMLARHALPGVSVMCFAANATLVVILTISNVSKIWTDCCRQHASHTCSHAILPGPFLPRVTTKMKKGRRRLSSAGIRGEGEVGVHQKTPVVAPGLWAVMKGMAPYRPKGESWRYSKTSRLNKR